MKKWIAVLLVSVVCPSFAACEQQGSAGTIFPSVMETEERVAFETMPETLSGPTQGPVPSSTSPPESTSAPTSPPESTPAPTSPPESTPAPTSPPKPDTQPNPVPTFQPAAAPTVRPDPEPASRPAPPPDPDLSTGTSMVEGRDDNGSILWEEIYAADGTLLRRTDYEPDGTVCTTDYDANGNTLTITSVNAQRTRVQRFYENGTCKSVCEISADGIRFEQAYNAAGLLSYQISMRSTGSFHEEQYYDSGTPKKITDVNKEENIYTEKVYYENGNLSYEAWRYSSDDYGEKQYHENGKLSYVCDYLAAANNSYGYLEMFYDKNGNLTEQRWKEIFSNGYGYALRQWRADTGVAEGLTYRSDGTVWYEVRRGRNWETKYQVE